VFLGDIVNQFLDQYGFANAGSSEESYFSSPGVWSDQVDNLDSGFKYLGTGILFLEGRRRPMNWKSRLSVDRALFVDGVAYDVEQPAQHSFSYGNTDRRTAVRRFHASRQSVRGG
jgi:hypothetical protein